MYIHIPFCLRKCFYCDFYSVTDLSLKNAFLGALAREMQSYAGRGLAVDTLYLGGGTPSVLTPAEIEQILSRARRCFTLLPDAELTLEVNPATVTRRTLSDYRRSGINRIHVGVQSFQNPLLGFLGRIHTAAEALDCIGRVRRAGFANMGLDLIYGAPGQNETSWRADLDKAVSFRPEHLSCYLLSYEGGTPLERDLHRGRFRPLPEARIAKLFIETVRRLGRHGYVQYEISNFTQAGPGGTGLYPSRHNQKYWNFAPYLGLGPSAHSFLQPVRFWNPRSLKRYIRRVNAGAAAAEGSEALTMEQQMLEAVYLGLRTAAGICVDRFNQKFKRDFFRLFGAVLSELEAEKLMKVEKTRCFLTCRGMLLLDSIVARIVALVPDQI